MSCENEDLTSLTPEQLDQHRNYHQNMLIAAAFYCPSFIYAGSFDFSFAPNFAAAYHTGRINRIAEALKNQSVISHS